MTDRVSSGKRLSAGSGNPRRELLVDHLVEVLAGHVGRAVRRYEDPSFVPVHSSYFDILVLADPVNRARVADHELPRHGFAAVAHQKFGLNDEEVEATGLTVAER